MNTDTEEVRLYTILIFTENCTGALSLVSNVFTRRQVNIESITACYSSIPGVHKYTITCYCTESMVNMLVLQMERKIDVLKAKFYTDDEIYSREMTLQKLSSPRLWEDKEISRIIDRHNGRIVEVNPIYTIVEKMGFTDEIEEYYNALQRHNCVLQFVRTGRTSITRSDVEELERYLEDRERERPDV